MIPALSVTILAAAVSVWAVRCVPALWRSPRPRDALVYFDPEESARALPTVLALGACALSVTAVALWSAYAREGDGAEPVLQWAMTVAVGAWLIVPSAVGWFGRPRFLVPPRLRTAEGRERLHDVSVMDVRPALGEDAYEPYFIAVCECGWTSDPVATEAEAHSAGGEHASTVRPGLERPVG